MRKWAVMIAVLIFFVTVLLLCGCKDESLKATEEILSQWQPREYDATTAVQPVTHVGAVPTALDGVVERNLFAEATACGNRVLRVDVLEMDEGNRTCTHRVTMLDLYGAELAQYSCTSSDSYHIRTLMGTEDGGFLFVLGFSDKQYDKDTWASDGGFASRVIKCDAKGEVQFDVPFDQTEGRALEFCYEKNGELYFFGTMQAPETKHRGVYSSTDILCTVMDGAGNVLRSKGIAGSDFDSVTMAEPFGDRFILSVSSQSDDGDFSGSDSKGFPVDWVLEIDDSLEIVNKEKRSGRDFMDTKIGEREGRILFRSDAVPESFDGGLPYVYLDYGEYYLIVSENQTGIYENIPAAVSAIWYYTETVYSGYDSHGELLFRTSVDSSPNYMDE